MKAAIRSLGLALSGALAAALLATTADAADHVARIGHLESPEQSRHIHLQKVADRVKERTGGAVEFQLFPQGQLGTQREMTEATQLGVIEATVSPAAFLGGFNPAVSILDIPFLLPADEQTAQEIRGGDFGEALLETFSDRGVTAIALWPNGHKHFTSNKPLDDLTDLSGQKFRVMDSRILIEQFNALGASAIALPFGEVYTSLQTGVVDGQENPLDTILKMKFYEVQDNLVVSGHGALEDVVLFNPTFWDGLPDEYKTIIREEFEAVIPDLVAHKAGAVEAAFEEIKASGISVREASEEEKAALREVMYPAGRAAYVERAGEEGERLVEIYEAAYEEATN